MNEYVSVLKNFSDFSGRTGKKRILAFYINQRRYIDCSIYYWFDSGYSYLKYNI